MTDPRASRPVPFSSYNQRDGRHPGRGRPGQAAPVIPPAQAPVRRHGMPGRPRPRSLDPSSRLGRRQRQQLTARAPDTASGRPDRPRAPAAPAPPAPGGGRQATPDNSSALRRPVPHESRRRRRRPSATMTGSAPVGYGPRRKGRESASHAGRPEEQSRVDQEAGMPLVKRRGASPLGSVRRPRSCNSYRLSWIWPTK